MQLLLAPLSFAMLFYMFLLVQIENIFYFPAPYTDGSFSIVSIASYLPFSIVALILPLLLLNRKVMIEPTWNLASKGLFMLNNIAYMILIALFLFWGLYNVFSY